MRRREIIAVSRRSIARLVIRRSRARQSDASGRFPSSAAPGPFAPFVVRPAQGVAPIDAAMAKVPLLRMEIVKRMEVCKAW